MPTATKAPPESKPASTPRPRVKVVCKSSRMSESGFTTDQPLRRTVPAADGLESYVMRFDPGTPIVLDEREIAACERDIDTGNLNECKISNEHLLSLLNDFVDAERTKQLAQLRATVGRLVDAIRKTGQFSQPDIDALLKG